MPSPRVTGAVPPTSQNPLPPRRPPPQAPHPQGSFHAASLASPQSPLPAPPQAAGRPEPLCVHRGSSGEGSQQTPRIPHPGTDRVCGVGWVGAVSLGAGPETLPACETADVAVGKGGGGVGGKSTAMGWGWGTEPRSAGSGTGMKMGSGTEPQSVGTEAGTGPGPHPAENRSDRHRDGKAKAIGRWRRDGAGWGSVRTATSPCAHPAGVGGAPEGAHRWQRSREGGERGGTPRTTAGGGGRTWDPRRGMGAAVGPGLRRVGRCGRRRLSAGAGPG